jgi:hypothetical protein
VYKSHQGADIEENLVCLCRTHHTLVHTSEREYRDKLIERQQGIYGMLEMKDLKRKDRYDNFKYRR